MKRKQAKRRNPYPREKDISKVSDRDLKFLLDEGLRYGYICIDQIRVRFKNDFLFHREYDKLKEFDDRLLKEQKKREHDKQLGETKARKERRKELSKVHFKWKEIPKSRAMRLFKKHKIRRTKTYQESDHYYLITMDELIEPNWEETIGHTYDEVDFFDLLTPNIILVGAKGEQCEDEMLFRPRRKTDKRERILQRLSKIQELLSDNKIDEAIERFSKFNLDNYKNESFYKEVEEHYEITRDDIERKKKEVKETLEKLKKIDEKTEEVND